MAHWTSEEHKTLELLLTDGVELNLLCDALSERTADAIHRQAQKHDYGVKTVDGVKYMYDGKKTRNRNKKDKAETIVGEARVATTTPEPTTSESLYNLSNDIVASSTANVQDTGLNANSVAVKMLQEYNLLVDPSIVFELSQHIINNDIRMLHDM